MPPETRYAKSGDLNIAYQVVGDGPRDLVFVPGWVSNVEYMWEEPSFAAFLRRLASRPLINATPRPLFRCSNEKDFQPGIGEDDSSNIATVHDNVVILTRIPDLRVHPVAHARHLRHHRDPVRHRVAAHLAVGRPAVEQRHKTIFHRRERN